MKKIYLLPCMVVLLVFCVLGFTSCSKALETPSNITLDIDSQSISWDSIPNATRYLVVIGESEKTTLSTSYSLGSLEPGEYEVKIKALGDGDTFADSKFATYQYTREKESGLIYVLTNNNTEYQLKGIGSASGDVIMEDVYRGKPVTSIAPSALANNDKITSFVIGKNVDSIPLKAFYNCNALVSVTIPDNVKSIAENAFQSCRSLKSVVLPEGVTEVSNYAFSYCRALESVTLSSATTRIGDFAFSDCSSLKSIYIPEYVTYVGDYAFSGCSAATKLEIGSHVETIGEYAFYSLPLVESVVLPDTLISIGDSAFEECSGISQIVIPAEVTTIGSRAFAFCEKLETITVGDKIQKIGRNAFLNTAYLNNYPDEIVYLGNWVIVCTNPDIQENRDLSDLLKKETVGLADYAFYGCNKFTSVSMSNVKYIGDHAFSLCDNLMSIRLGNSALHIGDYAFYDCDHLVDVIISNTSINYIGNYSFYNCQKLKSIDLPDTVEMIGSWAFQNTGLTPAVDGVIYADNWAVGWSGYILNNITLRDGTVGISKYCFSGCAYIGSVVMPDTIKFIGRGAFLLCTNIYINKLPAQLKTIGDYAFYGCTGGVFGADYNLVFPEGLESIGRSAFYTTPLCGVEIPGSCKYIGDYAFFNCRYLGGEVEFYSEPPKDSSDTDGSDTSEEEEITIEKRRFYLVLNEGIETIGSRAFYGTGIISLNIPDSVTSLGIRSFYKCTDLQEVTIGSGLLDIPDYAFYNCSSLQALTLSDQTISIGEKAFYGCKALTDVTLGASLQTIGTAAFMNCEALEHLVLPTSVTSIGQYAFRGLKSDTAVIVHSGLTNVEDHAFYGNTALTIYVEGGTDLTAKWGKWNSSWRPTVYHCTLSEDKSYVVSVEKRADSILNTDAIGGLTAPTRQGYEFLGWATTSDGLVEYSADSIMNAPDGTVLYAVWQIVQSNE